MANDPKITTRAPNPWRKNFDYGTNERQERIKKLIRKHKSRKKVAMLDSFALTDPMAGQITVQPYPPAESAPIGLLDGIYPQEDREGKPVGEAPLYYGIMETHMADDANSAEDQPISAEEFAQMVNNVRVIKDVLSRPHHTVDPHARKILIIERDKMLKGIVSAINKDPSLLAKVRP